MSAESKWSGGHRPPLQDPTIPGTYSKIRVTLTLTGGP